MKILVFLFLLINFSLLSQTKVFSGERTHPNDIVYTITNQKIVRMTSSLWGLDVLFIRGNKVYGDSFKSNCLYTIVGNKIFKGDSDSVFDQLYELDNDQLFLVSSGSLRKCLYTFSNDQVFVGDSRSSFDCISSIQFDEAVINSKLLIFLCLAPY